jgi:hypothetical protein
MKKPILTLLCLLVAPLATVAAEKPATAYLFTYFTGNGADGLHLAWSNDGLKWEALGGGKSFLVPTVGQSKLMRDPCMVAGADDVYHLVWTSGWHENNIGYASTKDFTHWSKQLEIPVMAQEPTVRNTWAPEAVWDKEREQFLIFWSSTIPGRFPETAGTSEDELNHRIYATTTKDWRFFTPTRLYYDPGFSVIDATILPVAGGYQLLVKDETKNPVKKHLLHAFGKDVEGPWGKLSEPFTRDWVEGPTVLKIGDAWIVYFDVYKEKHYGALRTRDWKTFEDITAQLAMPEGLRHGTAIEVPYALIERLLKD